MAFTDDQTWKSFISSSPIHRHMILNNYWKRVTDDSENYYMCLVVKKPPLKFTRSYIRASCGEFSISSLERISMKSFSSFVQLHATLLFV